MWMCRNFLRISIYPTHVGGGILAPCCSIGGIVTYQSPILLKGAHDKVIVHLVDTSPIKNHDDNLEELKQSGVNAKLNISQS